MNSLSVDGGASSYPGPRERQFFEILRDRSVVRPEQRGLSGLASCSAMSILRSGFGRIIH